jgi:Holliday junction DNA helicase RuvA
MITSLHGTLITASPLAAVVEVNGIGYEVNIPVTTAERLPAPGGDVRLHTLVVYREDAQTLYGFASGEERDFFRLLIEKVTGVGPKLALSILSRLSLPLLQSAIAAGDVGMLSKCPGIGRKTAERLVVELKGQLPGGSGPAAGGPLGTGGADVSDARRDAIKALVTLGYKIADADRMIREAGLALGPDATIEQLLKRALG